MSKPRTVTIIGAQSVGRASALAAALAALSLSSPSSEGTRIVEKPPIKPTPTEVAGRRERFSRKSTSSFRGAVRDALDLRPFDRKKR